VVRQGGFEAGTVFVPKPFTPQTLTARLRQALDRVGHVAPVGP
jgi:DNA-binding response OmpR family regulator